MTAGIEIYNDSNILQLTSEATNYYLVASGSVTATLPTAADFASSVSISPGVTFDIICLATSATDMLVHPPPIIIPSSTTYTAKYWGYSTGSSGSRTINYWCFRAYSALSPMSTCAGGFEVYTSSSAVAYSTQQPKILRTYTKQPISSLPALGTDNTISLPSGKTWAFCDYGVTKKYFTFAGGKGPVDASRGLAARIGTNSIIYSCAGRAGRTLVDIYTGGIVPVDVTGY